MQPFSRLWISPWRRAFCLLLIRLGYSDFFQFQWRNSIRINRCRENPVNSGPTLLKTLEGGTDELGIIIHTGHDVLEVNPV